MASTNDLVHILKAKKDLQNYLAANKDCFLECSLSEYLNQLIMEKGLKKSTVISESLLPPYAYEIFSGKKMPSRDKMLQLCFGLHLDFEEAQHLLYVAGTSSLYAKNRRDSIIIHCLSHGKTIFDCNEHLLQAEEAIFE